MVSYKRTNTLQCKSKYQDIDGILIIYIGSKSKTFKYLLLSYDASL